MIIMGIKNIAEINVIYAGKMTIYIEYKLNLIQCHRKI